MKEISGRGWEERNMASCVAMPNCCEVKCDWNDPKRNEDPDCQNAYQPWVNWRWDKQEECAAIINAEMDKNH